MKTQKQKSKSRKRKNNPAQGLDREKQDPSAKASG